jgi:hypothetical protein
MISGSNLPFLSIILVSFYLHFSVLSTFIGVNRFFSGGECNRVTHSVFYLFPPTTIVVSRFAVFALARACFVSFSFSRVVSRSSHRRRLSSLALEPLTCQTRTSVVLSGERSVHLYIRVCAHAHRSITRALTSCQTRTSVVLSATDCPPSSLTRLVPIHTSLSLSLSPHLVRP